MKEEVTHDAQGQDPGGWALFDLAINLQHTTLVLTGLDGWLDRPDPINQLVVSSPSTNVLLWPNFLICTCNKQAPNSYLLGARRWWLRVNCIKRIEIWALLNYTVISNVYWKPEIGKSSKTSQQKYTSNVYPSEPRWMGFPLGTFPTQVGLSSGWWSIGPVKNK